MLTGTFTPERLVFSNATAAEKLNVAESYIYRLVNEGHLERLVITDTAGREIGRGITEDSVKEFAKRTRNRKRQMRLPLSAVDES